uniref:Protein kinase domain-containing protein n=1 Tax=Globodera pallida TaxID=36090 RepID=A0A183C5D5_GLOPA
MHTNKIMHRDLTARNVLSKEVSRGQDGDVKRLHVKVTDFGLSKRDVRPTTISAHEFENESYVGNKLADNESMAVFAPVRADQQVHSMSGKRRLSCREEQPCRIVGQNTKVVGDRKWRLEWRWNGFVNVYKGSRELDLKLLTRQKVKQSQFEEVKGANPLSKADRRRLEELAILLRTEVN